MDPVVIGIGHKTAPVELREKFYLRPLEREIILSELKSDPSVTESLILSTCNRTEIYASGISEAPLEDSLIGALFRIKKVKMTSKIKAAFYSYRGEKCVRHLLHVSTGLESLVLGEKQILGQVKEAVELSRRKGMLAKPFNILMDIAVRAGKKAQNETDIGCGGISVSWAAVKMAEQKLTTLSGKGVMILGAGKMSALTADQLKNKKISRLYVMNRTKEKAQTLAGMFSGEAVSFLEIREVLNQVDVCICSASAPHYLIEKEFMYKVMADRAGRELIFIDISTPRNIDPRVRDIRGVILLTIDNLEQVVKENMAKRQAAIDQVEHIILRKITELSRKLSNTQLYEKAAAIANSV